MDTEALIEKCQRMILREFLLEPGLLEEVGLEHVPGQLCKILICAEKEAVERLVASPFLEPVKLEQLKTLLAIRDMALTSRTAAALSAELKQESVSYENCCRMALCYAVIGSHGHVYSALRAAAAKSDAWARHHYLYGLILALEQNVERARWELGIALQYEPYEEGRVRIRRAMDLFGDD